MIKEKILAIYEDIDFNKAQAIEIFNQFINLLNTGEIRSAQQVDGKWIVNEWVKKGILLGFRLGEIIDMPYSQNKNFTDKNTYPEKSITAKSGIRIVPGGSSIRTGAYVAKGVTIMPPAYINVGAYVDTGTMVDSHALVGSCAQIGKGVHLSAGAMVGGVLEPINAQPVIIEDNAFIGGNSGLYEGVIIQKNAILAPGTIITKATPVFDAVNDKYLDFEKSPCIPENAVVVPGSRPLKSNPNFHLYCPIIVKYRDAKSSASVELEKLLR
jgi:2,3,4,5-tetrahydropyridine-2-carboxylate N-succinyltransferase